MLGGKEGEAKSLDSTRERADGTSWWEGHMEAKGNAAAAPAKARRVNGRMVVVMVRNQDQIREGVY
jgi:hypothetical protein